MAIKGEQQTEETLAQRDDRERLRWRFEQATEAGLEPWEAKLFADGDGDIGELRRLVKLHASPRDIARIVL